MTSPKVNPVLRRAFLGLVFGLALAGWFSGCGHKPKTNVTSVADPPTVRQVQPQRRTIVRTVGQPSFVESYERTSIYPKLTAFIEKWHVDIGDPVEKGQILADLFVPEVEEDYRTKGAIVELDKQKIELALTDVKVAAADVKAAEARLESARSILEEFQAQVDRWDSEVKRLARESKGGIVDRQVLDESRNQLRASSAKRDSAKADIQKAEADLQSKQAMLRREEVAVEVARADLAVATSDWKRMQAWVGYLKLYAPFDGVIVARNANTGDFVLPASGDPTADNRSPFLSPDAKAAPIYVVDRTDIVRVFVDVPEQDANYVHVGSKASVLIRAFRDQWIPATVTRTSWALNVKSRTLRAEIDLHNDGSPEAYRDAGDHAIIKTTEPGGGRILPGMYAYAKVTVESANVWAVPVRTLAHAGEKTYYWSHDNGRAVRMEVQTGVTDGEWIEVTNRLAARQLAENAPWQPIDGSEKLIVGDLSILAEGSAVSIVHQPVVENIASDAPVHPGVNGPLGTGR